MSPAGQRALVLLAGAAAVAVLGWRLFTSDALRQPAGDDFAAWERSHRVEVAAYLGFLREHRVAGVLPPRQLLRLGRRWRACGGEAFAVPPRTAWPAIVPTLSLLGELRAGPLGGQWDAVSVYRPASFNRCEGGSPGSRHLDNAAIDLQARGQPDVAALCAAWRRLGPARGWGLGFYARDRIHLDTRGFRTWGFSYHADSSLCRSVAAGAGGNRLESTRLPTPEPP